MPVALRLIAKFTPLAFLIVHFVFCFRVLGRYESFSSNQPWIHDDHAFHTHYVWLTRRFISETGSTAGYDPYFMGGYAKSIWFPSSSTLGEWFSFFGSPWQASFVYKLFVLSSSMAAPVVFFAGSKSWERQLGFKDFYSSLIGLTAYLTYFWNGPPGVYLAEGMVPFFLSGPVCLWSAAVLFSYCRSGSKRDLALGSFLLPIACLTHVCSAVALAPALILETVSCAWNRRMRIVAMLVVAAVTLAVNIHWLLPGITLLETKGSLATGIGFIHREVFNRFVQLFGQQPWIELALILLLPVGLAVAFRNGLGWFWSVLLGWSFFLGYLAAYFPILDSLQPGRYTLYFFTFACLLSAIAVSVILGRLARNSKTITLLLTLLLVWGVFASVVWQSRIILSDSPSLIALFPPTQQTLIEILPRRFGKGERILFEERNKGFMRRGKKFNDSIGHSRLSAVLPMLTNLEIVGGPYLYTHLATNFTQFGDGKLMGKENWTREEFLQYVDLYDIHGIVLWSPISQEFFDANKDLFKNPALIDRQFLVARLTPPSPSIRAGKAKVQARPNHLSVHVERTDAGRVVLPYHFVPGLRAEPACELRPLKLLDDPVPFIEMVNPATDVEIRFNPWQR